MKKLILMATIAMSALVAPAATVTWTMTNVYGPSGSLNNGSAYMFGYNSDSGISHAMIVSSIQSAFIKNGGVEGVSELLTNNYKWSPSSAGTYTDTNSKIDPVSKLGLEAGSTYNFYVVIFDTDTLSSESKFFVSKELTSKKVPTGSSNLLLGFGSMATSSQAEGAWQAIPEPTSGLLLLLGAAGLALKRKHI